MNSQDYKTMRKLLDELDITKPDIQKWVNASVEQQVANILTRMAKEGALDKIVSTELNRHFKLSHGWTSSEVVKGAVAKLVYEELRNKLIISIDEKEL